MQRRSFFGVLGAAFGGVLVGRVPRPPESVVIIDPVPLAENPGALHPEPQAYTYYPMKGGFYKPGDAFKIGRRRITKVD